MAVKVDREVAAMQAALAALRELEQEEQGRVLDWLGDKLKITPPSHDIARGGLPTSGIPSGAPSSGRGTVTPKAFLAQKKPATDVERITCLAYYLTHYRTTAHFKTKDLTALNKDAAQPKFSNAAFTARNATSQSQYLAQAGAGSKQITARGESLVEALPDREQVKAALEANPPARRHRKSGKASAMHN